MVPSPCDLKERSDFTLPVSTEEEQHNSVLHHEAYFDSRLTSGSTQLKVFIQLVTKAFYLEGSRTISNYHID